MTGSGPTKRDDQPRAKRRTWRLSAAVVAAAAVAGAGVGAGTAAVSSGRPQAVVKTAPASTRPAVLDVPKLLQRVLPAVVSIQTIQSGGGQGAGTGIVITPNGEVLTNAHVVDGASSISVTRYGTTRALSAELVGAAAADDL